MSKKSTSSSSSSSSKVRVSSSSSSSRMIPNNVRATILSIKEISSNHSDLDIYSLLQHCSMDPIETTQRLLFLDTFHEVKSKRHKRKENMKSTTVGESTGKLAYQWRGSRGARGTSYPQYSYDSGEQKNAAIRRENVAGETREKRFRASSVTLNEPVEVPNGGLHGGQEAQTSGVGVTTNLLREEIDADSNKSTVVPKGAAFDSSQTPAAIGAVKGEAQIQQMSSESNEPTPFDRGQGTTESITCSPLNEHDSHILNEPRTSLPMTEKVASGHSNVAPPKILGQCPPAEKVQPPASVSVVRSCSPQGVDEATSKIEKLKFCDGQHVIIPSHIQVPDDVKNMLSFGSFGVREKHSNTENNEESNSAAAKVHDETTSKSSSCEEEAMPADTEGKHVDQPQAPVHILERNSPSEPQVSSCATVVSMKEDNLAAAVGPPFPVVEAAPSYTFGFMPPLLVDPLVVKPDMFESQPHVSNSQAGVSPTMTNSSSTPPPPPPPPVQCAGAGQNSVAPSPASIALLRQSYPPTNYAPYSHYYSPFYPPSPYFGHPAFPTTILAPGNMYLPPPPGMKLSPAAYKPPGGAAANTGNQPPPVELPSAAPYNHHPAHLTFNPTAASGNSIGTEDIVPSLLKENSSYVGQQSEGSTTWVPSAGRDAGSFPLGAYRANI